MNIIPHLHSERLLLRRFTDTDLENVYRGLSHPQVIPYYGVRYDSLEAAKAQMAFFRELEETGTGAWFAVCGHDGTFYGAGGFNGLQRAHRKAEVGFWLLPEHWGKGILQEAMPLLCRYAFTTLGLHRIEGFVESENAACRRAMTRVGFRHEGTMRDCEWKDGRFISLDIFALLATDALPATRNTFAP